MVNQIQSGAEEMRLFSSAENLVTLRRLQQNLAIQIYVFGNEFVLRSQVEMGNTYSNLRLITELVTLMKRKEPVMSLKSEVDELFTTGRLSPKRQQ